MTGRRILAAAGALAVAAGAWAGASLPGSSPAQASRPTVAVGTAVVHRRDLAVTDLVNGTLGYHPGAPVINRLAGTYTALPAEGSTVGRGHALYQVDGGPVVLMYGSQPAWRAFTPGIPDGPDVAELEANLVALGFARGLFGTPDAHFDWATAAVVRRWQRAIGPARTGTVQLGRVVFLPGAVRVGAHQAAVGAIASPGAEPYTATSPTPRGRRRAGRRPPGRGPRRRQGHHQAAGRPHHPRHHRRGRPGRHGSTSCRRRRSWRGWRGRAQRSADGGGHRRP
jgi:Putative peptidoglycan binding domain